MDIDIEDNHVDWDTFKFHPFLRKMIEKNGLTEPTAVQKDSFRFWNKPFDLLISAQTGSGKTFCYLFPLISSLLEIDLEEE